MDEYPLNRSEPDTSVNAGRLHASDGARYGRTRNRFGWLTRESGSVRSAEFGLKCQ